MDRWRADNQSHIRQYDRARSRDVKFGKGADKHFKHQCSIQKDCCAVCHKPLEAVKKPSLDHNHQTGQWRGVLCSRCNIALGYYENMPLMAAALEYLKQWGLR